MPYVNSALRSEQSDRIRSNIKRLKLSHNLADFCIETATAKTLDFIDVMFADEATLDNNLVSLRHALDVVGSHRIAQLRSVEDDSAMWSLLLINRHEVRTQCLILKPEAR